MTSEKLGHECRQFLEQFKTLILSTADENGVPDASTAPYVLLDGHFYILVSELARHTTHLLRNQRCCAFFVDDESSSVNLFARKRLSIHCEVTTQNPTQPQSQDILDRLAEKFGPTVGMLRQLPDFHLLQLRPIACNFVRGFGQAFRFEPQQHPEMWK
jgi:heme iron utilization protein